MTTTPWDAAARKLISEVWGDIQRSQQKRDLAAIRAEPTKTKHRLTRIMDGSTNYVFFPGGWRPNGKSRAERTAFCVSKGRNAAGSFLLWRQVDRYKRQRGGKKKMAWYQTERFDFMFSTSKRELHDLAEKKAQRDKDSLATPA